MDVELIEHPTAPGLDTVSMGALAREISERTEEGFRARYPHPFLIVVYCPPAEVIPGIGLTRSSTSPDLAGPRETGSPKRVIPVTKSGVASLLGRVLVGRDLTSDILIRSSKVSRAHAVFVPGKRGRTLLEDQGSVNGTLVNGNRLAPGRTHKLKSGDSVAFWRYLLRYVELDAFVAMIQGMVSKTA